MDTIDAWMNRVGDSQKGKKSQKASTSSKEKKKFSFFKRKKDQPKSDQKPQKGGTPPRGQKPQRDRKPPRGQNSHRGGRPARKDAIKRPVKKSGKAPEILRNTIKVIPLGGLNEVGKNMMAIEYEEDIMIIDMGFEFPSEDLLGIDYIIPDVSYLEENKKRIRGVVLTHGHLDHIGGVPYILPKLDFPTVYAAKLTMGLVNQRVKEFKLEKMAKLKVIDPDKDVLKLGKMTVSFFRVAHSIPDAMGIIIDTPAGKIVHTGDFKFDATPPRNMVKVDVGKIEALGKQNVLALFCESTNSSKPGHTMSEKDVGEALDRVIAKTKGRVIIASFSSQIGRLQQIIDAGAKHNRKVFISGRSMRQNIETASELGYLNFPKDLIWDIKRYPNSKTPDDQTLIITTGSQGEAMSALSRIARGEHSSIKAKKGDTIVLSSSPIIGNERAINVVINNLCMLGVDVIHNQMEDIHTSGHGRQEELARMINLINPKYLIPIHGEYYMRQGLSKLAQAECGIPEDKIILLRNGDILLAGKEKVQRSKNSIETKYILIDGRGEGHAGSQVQVEREILSQNGAIILLIHVVKKGNRLKHIDVVTRGFIYMHESEAITRDIVEVAKKAYNKIRDKNPGAKPRDIKRFIMQSVDKYTRSNLERRPLVVPLMVD